MKDKLEVGMYCYNKTNRKMGIGKIISFESNNNVNVRYKNDIELVSIGNLEASNDIIDILEKGDYVNGDLVLFAGATTWDNDGNALDKQVHINHNGYDLWLREEYIKSIVTKEQMEQMSYRIGD